jgi:hypothetical protein
MTPKNIAPRDGTSKYESKNALWQFADTVNGNTGANIQLATDSELHRFDNPEGKRQILAWLYVWRPAAQKPARNLTSLRLRSEM